MNLIDEEYYDDYFEKLSKERKIQFLELYEEYSYSKIEILLSIIFLFPFNIFKEHFKNYKTHRILSLIDFILLCGYMVMAVWTILMLMVSATMAVFLALILVIFIYGYIIFSFACRIFIIVQVPTIINMSQISAKAKVYSVMEGEI